MNARSANLLNHTNVTTVGTVVGSPTFTQPLAAEAARRVTAYANNTTSDTVILQCSGASEVRVEPETEDELRELSDRWRPYRSLAVSYLFASEYEG